MKCVSVAFLVGILTGLFSILNPTASPSAEIETFATRVEEIDRLFQPQVDTIGEITRVLTIEPAFNDLSAEGDRLVDPCLAYLAEPGHTPLQRRIAILATHEASVPGWVRFSNKMLDMYEKHMVDIWELQDTIFPRRFYSNYAEHEFWRPSVRRVLWRMYNLKELDSNTRNRIINDLSGINRLLDWLFGSDPL